MTPVLYLASQSASRKKLLQEAGIPFTLLHQDADESRCDWGMSLQQVATAIARYKMEHVVLPEVQEGKHIVVLTADTLSLDLIDGSLSGKPKDRADALIKLRKARHGMRTGTAFCLQRYVGYHGAWRKDTLIEGYVQSEYLFSIPDDRLDEYIDSSWALNASGAIAIEGFGAQFLKEVRGSYSAIVGLPMFEVREGLTSLCFFK